MTWPLDNHPSESSGPDPEEKKTTTADQAEGPTEVLPDPQQQLQADLAASRSEAEQWRDRYLRAAAEFDNFRKRTEKEKTESVILAKSSVLAELLPVVDACERALDSFTEAGATESLNQYREGVELLYKKLSDALARLGVVPIKAFGEKFDPHLHEAVTREENLDYEEDTVTEELRRGYLFRDRLLRPAQVKVSTYPPEKEPGN